MIAGRARFTLDDETLDAPAGTLVFLPDPATRRYAVAEEAGTTVLAVGGKPGEGYEVSAWEWRFRAATASRRGRVGRGRGADPREPRAAPRRRRLAVRPRLRRGARRAARRGDRAPARRAGGAARRRASGRRTTPTSTRCATGPTSRSEPGQWRPWPTTRSSTSSRTSRTWRRKFELSPGLESRFARKPLELEQSGVSYYKIAPDFRTPFGHRHGEQEEVYVVVERQRPAQARRRGASSSRSGTRSAIPARRCAASRAGRRAPRCSRSARPTRTTRTPRWCRAGGATDAAQPAGMQAIVPES